MFHVKDDFVAGEPISKVGAGWFNAVGKFLNNLVGGEGVTIDKHGDGSPSVINVEVGSGSMGDAPVDNTTNSPDDTGYTSHTPTFTDWNAGGENGMKLRVYGIATGTTYDHELWPFDIEITNTGTIKSVKLVSDKAFVFGA